MEMMYRIEDSIHDSGIARTNFEPSLMNQF